MKHYIVGLTGASCSIYGIRLIEELIKLDNQVSVIFSNNGLKVRCARGDHKVVEV